MDRKEFLKKGLLGTGIFATTGALANVVKNDIDELKELEVLGFNHIPNTNSKIMEQEKIMVGQPRLKPPHRQDLFLFQEGATKQLIIDSTASHVIQSVAPWLSAFVVPPSFPRTRASVPSAR